MSKNDDFLLKNARFSRLIHHFANKLGDREAEFELWGFLWILYATCPIIPNDRYIAVCLRNHFIKLSKEKQKNSFFPLENNEPTTVFDYDVSIDLRNAVSRLKPKEQYTIQMRFAEDLTLEDMAKLRNTTRQNESGKVRRAVLKLRDILSEKEIED